MCGDDDSRLILSLKPEAQALLDRLFVSTCASGSGNLGLAGPKSVVVKIHSHRLLHLIAIKPNLMVESVFKIRLSGRTFVIGNLASVEFDYGKSIRVSGVA